MVLLVWAATGSPQSGIVPARLGFVKDSANSVRPVFGLAANFVVGDPLITGVQAAAFSANNGLVKQENILLLVDVAGRPLCRWRVPSGPAVFAFSVDGREAVAFFPETPELLRLHKCRALTIAADPQELAGEVLSVAVFGKNRLAFVVRREAVVWLLEVSLRSGRVERETILPGVSPPVLLRHDGTLVFGDGAELVIRKPEAIEQRLSLGSAATALEEIGDGWIHVTTESPPGNSALRLSEDRAEMYVLPEATP